MNIKFNNSADKIINKYIKERLLENFTLEEIYESVFKIDCNDNIVFDYSYDYTSLSKDVIENFQMRIDWIAKDYNYYGDSLFDSPSLDLTIIAVKRAIKNNKFLQPPIKKAVKYYSNNTNLCCYILYLLMKYKHRKSYIELLDNFEVRQIICSYKFLLEVYFKNDYRYIKRAKMIFQSHHIIKYALWKIPPSISYLISFKLRDNELKSLPVLANYILQKAGYKENDQIIGLGQSINNVNFPKLFLDLEKLSYFYDSDSTKIKIFIHIMIIYNLVKIEPTIKNYFNDLNRIMYEEGDFKDLLQLAIEIKCHIIVENNMTYFYDNYKNMFNEYKNIIKEGSFYSLIYKTFNEFFNRDVKSIKRFVLEQNL